jgi:hypothetical protein
MHVPISTMHFIQPVIYLACGGGAGDSVPLRIALFLAHLGQWLLCGLLLISLQPRSQVIDTDAYYWFKEYGGMTRENKNSASRFCQRAARSMPT